MRPRLSKGLLLLLTFAPLTAQAKEKVAPDTFAVTMPAPPPAPPANGSIFQGAYVPLTSGGRAGQVGDIITIQLVERTAATKSNAAGTQRDGNIGLTPPSTGPLSLFNPSDVAMGGGQQFKGKGDASQSNALSGEVSVTVAAVYPNGTMLVKGEKLLTLNRGDERVQIAGIVRAIDISPDNRILSTRVANANIRYVGKGEIARASQQGWLQRFFSIISPF
ncbi:flagellar L-ring protein precursor FlgH [Sphingopyxis panaciterrae]|uniref:flagellar basal body L-ring protein FlgH n=1 Tax=Sphingopyxis panaciterrae TaxID=363841 RepID=UPI00141E66DA|nr:flagellar basal body L-ring protein FlgH [Sphingopyxis panaciterrae]NIJ39655.1 flagellar L-ring protein precursor FlgH [Sphingopyxis panaciterrae]